MELKVGDVLIRKVERKNFTIGRPYPVLRCAINMFAYVEDDYGISFRIPSSVAHYNWDKLEVQSNEDAVCLLHREESV